MKNDREYSTFDDKISEVLFTLVLNIKTMTVDVRVKKASALLALLFAGSVAKGLAEEVMGTIMFGPEEHDTGTYLRYEYRVDTTDDLIPDRTLIIAKNTYKADLLFDMLTKYYLLPGKRFMFENNGLKPFQDLYIDHVIDIEINGEMVELTKMFPIDVVKSNLHSLYEKLIREGRVR